MSCKSSQSLETGELSVFSSLFSQRLAQTETTADRLHIVDVEVSISRLALEDLLSVALTRISRLFEEVLAR